MCILFSPRNTAWLKNADTVLTAFSAKKLEEVRRKTTTTATPSISANTSTINSAIASNAGETMKTESGYDVMRVPAHGCLQ